MVLMRSQLIIGLARSISCYVCQAWFSMSTLVGTLAVYLVANLDAIIATLLVMIYSAIMCVFWWFFAQHFFVIHMFFS